MLGWEVPFAEKVERLREKEKGYLTKMALIRGSNQALVLFIQPLAAFVTFSVAWAQGRNLDITGAFYALVLLGLPKLSMAMFFVFGAYLVCYKSDVMILSDPLYCPSPTSTVQMILLVFTSHTLCLISTCCFSCCSC